MIGRLLFRLWRLRLLIVAGAALLALAVALPVLMRSPSADRVWDEAFARTPLAYPGTDGTVTLRDVRDYTYGDGTVVERRWVDSVTVRISDIERLWFVLEPFSEWKAVGHTFLTFALKDGSAYSFSIEARREPGEVYSAFDGVFRNYELAYTWGTERDFITRRLLYLKHPLRMYPLAVSPEAVRGLFRSLLAKTNELAIAPRFYNTLTANCTNMLARSVNEARPGAVPFDISWMLPGYSDRFLMKIGLIAGATSFEAAAAAYDLTPRRDAILPLALKPPAEFGAGLRALLPE